MTSWLASRRIVVTGGAGFLGRHVVNRLRQVGCREVFIPHVIDYDLTTEDGVVSALRDAKPQVVIHLAAKVGGIAYNRARPAELLYNNLMMGLLLMEQARQHGVEKFVAISSACAYPKNAPIPFREDNLWGGYPEEDNGPYGVAKRLLILQAQTYRQQYGLNAISLVPTNLYGPGDNFDPASSHVIPALIRRCIEATEAGRDHIEVWGTGEASREFLFVEDCAEAVVLATEHYHKADPINIGTGSEVTIRELAETIVRLTGFPGRIVWDPSKPEGQPRRRLDTSKAERELGFKAKTTLEEGLKKTIDWYSQQRDQPLRLSIRRKVS